MALRIYWALFYQYFAPMEHGNSLNNNIELNSKHPFIKYEYER